MPQSFLARDRAYELIRNMQDSYVLRSLIPLQKHQIWNGPLCRTLRRADSVVFDRPMRSQLNDSTCL